MKVWYPWQLKKIKILGAVLELPVPFTSKMGQMGWIGSAVQNGTQDFEFFNCHGCITFILAEIHCYLSALKIWHNNLFLSGVGSIYFRQLSFFAIQVLLYKNSIFFAFCQNKRTFVWIFIRVKFRNVDYGHFSLLYSFDHGCRPWTFYNYSNVHVGLHKAWRISILMVLDIGL